MIIDEEIVELFFERSEEAVNQLNIKYGKIFRKTSYNILNDPIDVEECVNDAYFSAWNKIPPTKPRILLAYVCQIVRNLSLKIYYKNNAIKIDSSYDIAMEELEFCLEYSKTVEDEIETNELTRVIENFLDTLSSKNRVIFLQRYWFCESYKEIAKKVGISEKDVSVRLTRIRKELKEYLLEEGII